MQRMSRFFIVEKDIYVCKYETVNVCRFSSKHFLFNFLKFKIVNNEQKKNENEEEEEEQNV